MGKLYSRLIKSSLLLLISALAFNHSTATSLNVSDLVPGPKPETTPLAVTSQNKPILPNSAIQTSFVPLSLFQLMGTPAEYIPFQTDTSSLLNVKVYPVPVADQVNVSYHVKKESNVTILLMDLLGNKLMTLFSKRVPAGEQTNIFSLRPRVDKGGIYFIKVTVGTQAPVSKRILVL
jgi:hypothetical protein